MRGAVDQTDEIEIIRHARQLAANSLQGKKESALKHENENELEAPCTRSNFQRLVNSVLTYCLSSGDNPKLCQNTPLIGPLGDLF